MAVNLPAFIQSLGVEKAAELFDEKPRTIKAWLYGERKPMPSTAIAKVIPRSKGKLTFASIYGDGRQ